MDGVRLSRRAILFMVFMTLVLVLGWRLGSSYRLSRAANREAALRKVQTERLRTRTPGIKIGMPFPPLTVWSADGSTAFDVRELLEQGGVILLVAPGCGSCIDAAQKLEIVLKQIPSRPLPGLLLADQAHGAVELQRLVSERGVALTVYCDVEEVLRRKEKISANPVYICLDKTGTVLDFGAGLPESGRLKEVFANGNAP